MIFSKVTSKSPPDFETLRLTLEKIIFFLETLRRLRDPLTRDSGDFGNPNNKVGPHFGLRVCF